jgi:hypothetical protein
MIKNMLLFFLYLLERYATESMRDGAFFTNVSIGCCRKTNVSPWQQHFHVVAVP